VQRFNVNACGPFWAVKYAPAAMSKTCSKGNHPNATPKPTTYGSIIVVSSTASVYGGMWGPVYTMTQHAVLGLVKSGVDQLKGSGIRINIVSGTIDMGIELSKVNQGGLAQLTGLVSGDDKRPYARESSPSEECLAEFRAYQTNSGTRAVWGTRRSGKSSWVSGQWI
jgi:NAD(P)-dependent dehydrogenase (short-subunit alcohol dehydrogenase family)